MTTASDPTDLNALVPLPDWQPASADDPHSDFRRHEQEWQAFRAAEARRPVRWHPYAEAYRTAWGWS